MSNFREWVSSNTELNETHKYHISKDDKVGVTVFDSMEELRSKVSKKGLKELQKAETILDLDNPTKEQLWDVFSTIFNYSTEEHWKKWSKHMSK